MKYLHTMVRVTDLEASLEFYCENLGLRETRRREDKNGRYTLVFLSASGDEDAQVELTYNWDPEPYTGGRNFGHLAYEVSDIYATCAVAGPNLNRVASKGRCTRAKGALGIDAKYRGVVASNPEVIFIRSDHTDFF